jgi:hypothetical protein
MDLSSLSFGYDGEHQQQDPALSSGVNQTRYIENNSGAIACESVIEDSAAVKPVSFIKHAINSKLTTI